MHRFDNGKPTVCPYSLNLGLILQFCQSQNLLLFAQVLLSPQICFTILRRPHLFRASAWQVITTKAFCSLTPSANSLRKSISGAVSCLITHLYLVLYVFILTQHTKQCQYFCKFCTCFSFIHRLNLQTYFFKSNPLFARLYGCYATHSITKEHAISHNKKDRAFCPIFFILYHLQSIGPKFPFNLCFGVYNRNFFYVIIFVLANWQARCF